MKYIWPSQFTSRPKDISSIQHKKPSPPMALCVRRNHTLYEQIANRNMTPGPTQNRGKREMEPGAMESKKLKK